MVTKSVGR